MAAFRQVLLVLTAQLDHGGSPLTPHHVGLPVILLCGGCTMCPSCVQAEQRDGRAEWATSLFPS